MTYRFEDGKPWIMEQREWKKPIKGDTKPHPDCKPERCSEWWYNPNTTWWHRTETWWREATPEEAEEVRRREERKLQQAKEAWESAKKEDMTRRVLTAYPPAGRDWLAVALNKSAYGSEFELDIVPDSDGVLMLLASWKARMTPEEQKIHAEYVESLEAEYRAAEAAYLGNL